jgi:hypothetical protein
MKEWVQRLLLGVSLISFAGVVFYIVAPKWHYLAQDNGELRAKYNAITGSVWSITDGRYIVGEKLPAYLGMAKKMDIREPKPTEEKLGK